MPTGPERSAESGASGFSNRRRTVVFRENAAVGPHDTEREPLLPRLRRRLSDPFFDPSPPPEPVFSCTVNHHTTLPVYTNIHRIRIDIQSVVEDYLSLDQLRDVRINLAVVRPLVDKLYDLDDISIVYCLLVNKAHFLNIQSHLSNRQNVNATRATLCELVATRILRRWREDNPGDEGLLTLAHILVAGFEPFQGAPPDVLRKANRSGAIWSYTKTLPALEVAILSDCKFFLSSTTCQKVVDGIYEGQIVYTPSSFIDLIPDHYKQKPITIYNPREAPLLNQYRLIVPKMRNMLEIVQFLVLLGLYLAFMSERDPTRLSSLEVCFSIYAFSWGLDQFATILEHGWHVYTQNLWSFLDVIFIGVFWTYLIIRLHGWRIDSLTAAQQALDVLAMGAPVLVPRLAFNLLSDNLVFVSLRAMMGNFLMLTALSVWCFGGFMLSMIWLGDGSNPKITLGKWMLWIWFGLDGTGITKSTEFHWLLGPTLMVTFAFLGNTLFLTILVSMLSHTFSTIVTNAEAEIQFRKAVVTLEGVKSDAIFAYQPPFNLIAIFFFLPLKFIVSARWFHKIHVFTVRTINLPLLLLIAYTERRLWTSPSKRRSVPEGVAPAAAVPATELSFWGRLVMSWRITTHGDLDDVFLIDPPESIKEDIHADDGLTKHLIRRQFQRSQTNESLTTGSSLSRHKRGQSSIGSVASMNLGRGSGGGGGGTDNIKPLTRRDSMFPQLAEQLRDAMSSAEDVGEMGGRISVLEHRTARIETMLEQLCASKGIMPASPMGSYGTPGGHMPGRNGEGHDGDGSSDTFEAIASSP